MKIVGKLFLVALFVLVLSGINESSYAENELSIDATADLSVIFVDERTIDYNTQQKYSISAGYGGTVLTRDIGSSDWIISKTKKNDMRFKRKKWNNNFFEINDNFTKMYNSEGKIDDDNVQNKTLVDNCNINSHVNRDRFRVAVQQSRLTYNKNDHKLRLFVGSMEITSIDGYTIERISDHVVKLYNNNNPSKYFEVNNKDKTVWEVEAGAQRKLSSSIIMFVEISSPKLDSNIPLANNPSDAVRTTPALVSSSASTNPAVKNRTKWPIDFGLDPKDFAGVGASAWQVEQKKLFQAVLGESHFDTLLVPVQVNGHAIDHTGRSLMSYAIHNRLTECGVSLANPSLIARALGENNRIFDRQEIYALAQQMKARSIIMPLAGHYGAGVVSISFIRLMADSGGKFSDESTFSQTKTFHGPLSDEKPEYEVLLIHLDSALKELGYSITRKKTAAKNDVLTPPVIPASPLDLFSKSNMSIMENAYYLQLLGVLHPGQNLRMEELFERSLIESWQLDAKNPNRSLLIARALLYLNRRPLALNVLTKPETPEEKALYAYMDGDLLTLKEVLPQIKSPINKLVSSIEYQDLLWKYTRQPLKKSDIEQITNANPEWSALIMRRLLTHWEWQIQPNLYVKYNMDQVFPIEGYTAKGLAEGQNTLVAPLLIPVNVELSAYEHYRRTLTSKKESLFSAQEATKLKKIDLLELLYETSEANLIKGVTLSLFNRGIADEALEKIRSYEPAYKDHPFLTFMKGRALLQKARESQGEQRKQLEEEGKKLVSSSFFWPQGQVLYLEFQDYASDMPRVKSYEKDFPKRYYFLPIFLPQRQNLENSLLYTHDNFAVVVRLYNDHRQPIGNPKAKEFLSQLKNRFHGSPSLYELLATASENDGDLKGAEQNCRKAIESLPEDWTAYKNLGAIQIKQGEFEKSLTTFMSYPPFKEVNSTNSVFLANSAYEAATYFYNLGLTEKAKPLFDLSVSFDSGSGTQYYSQAYKSLVDNRYEESAKAFKLGLKRYELSEFYAGYIKTLHAIGRREEAWAVFDSLPSNKRQLVVWEAAISGLYLEGKSDEQIDAWFAKQINNEDIDFYLQRLVARSNYNFKISEKEPKEKRDYLDLYVRVRDGKDIKSKPIDYFSMGGVLSPFLPNMAFYYNSIGENELYEKKLATYSSIPRFNDMLAVGIISALNNKHEYALDQLDKAWRYIPFSYAGEIYLPPMYLLADSCELLYEKTGNKKYLDASLSYAKLHNAKDPTAFWPYGFIAKYSKDENERLSALGNLIYFDRNYVIGKKFSAKDVKSAKKIFNESNSFKAFLD